MNIKLTQFTSPSSLKQTLVCLITLLGVLAHSSSMAALPTPQTPVPLAALQSFVAVYERIRLQHVEAKTDEELLQFALEGLILKLDPFFRGSSKSLCALREKAELVWQESG